jgi:ubiquinone biosynthesis protein
LSTRPDLLPTDIAAELTKLQDAVPPFAGCEAMAIIAERYDPSIFASVDETPLASASVAQVHAATLREGLAMTGKNGEASAEVIVKILRPGIEQAVDRDLQVMYMFARLLDKTWYRAKQFRPLEVIREYENTIRGELDLRREAANCSQMGANFEHTDIIYVPLVYWDYTKTDIMVMERIYGTPVRDVETLKARGYDLEQLASDGVTTFFKQAFEDNFFHADMHPGNIFVSDEGKWIAVDFGIMGVLNESDKRYLAEMLLGFFNRDYRSIAESHLRAGWIPSDTQLVEFETAIRMVCEPNFAKPIAEISFGMVLMELFKTVQRFEMPVQPQLVLLYKTLLNIEGLGRQLYPQLNLWDTAKPFLENWMKQQLSPATLLSDIKRDWPRWRALLAALPDRLESMQSGSPAQIAMLAAKQQQADQLQKSRHALFHLALGFSIALGSLAIYVAAQAGLVDASVLAKWTPVTGVIGIIWAYWQSR